MIQETNTDAGLVDAKTLLVLVWDESCRPGLRTIRRWTKNGTIPYLRVGRGVFFDPPAVRRAITQNDHCRGYALRRAINKRHKVAA